MYERTDPQSARKQWAFLGPKVVPALMLLAVAVPALFELGLAIPWRAEVYFVYGAFWALILGAVTFLRGDGLDLFLTMACLILLAVLHWVPWNSRKVFLEDLWTVRPGMSVSEMEQVMGKYIQGSGWPREPLRGDGAKSPLSLPESGSKGVERRIYRHAAEGRFDSDWGVIYIEGGRVVSTEFLPD